MLKLYAILMAEDFRGFEEVNDFIMSLQKEKQFEVSDYLKELIRTYIVKNADDILDRLEKCKKEEDSQHFFMYVTEALLINKNYATTIQGLNEKFFYN